MKPRIAPGDLLAGMSFALAYPLGMPGYGVPFLPFAGLVPLLFLACSPGRTPREAARLGFLFGTIGNLLLYYWIAWTVAVPGRLGWALGAACALAVSAFVAAFIAAACAATCRCVERLGPAAAWSFPLFWTAAEMARIHLFTGFPWMLLGYSLAGSDAMRQAADLVGALGLGTLVALVNAALYRLALALRERDFRAALLPALAALLVAGGMAAYGTARLRGGPGPAAGTMRVGIAQGGIDQNRKWEPALQEATVAIYRDLTLEAAGKGAQVVVWPETAAPFFYGWEYPMSAMVDNVAIAARVPIVFGAPWFSPDGRGKYYNSVFLLGPDGIPAGRYDKRHLVPFGEYVPFRRLLPFISKLTAGEEDFSRGDSPRLFRIGRSLAAASVCYEAVFPGIVRESVLAGAGWLVNVTNDAWFGDTVAPHQHLAMARMRAVENRRPMVRAANSGISAVIRADGSIAGALGLDRKGVLVGEVTPGSEATTFSKTGELPGYSCIILSFLIFLYAWKGNHGHRTARGTENRP